MKLPSIAIASVLVACGSSSDGVHDVPPAPAPTTGEVAAPPATPPAAVPAAAPTSAAPPAAQKSAVVVTFNVGMHDLDPDDAYTGSLAKAVESCYGSGLAWGPAIADTAAWLKGVDADIVGLQEIFDPEECPSIPADKRTGLVCETWKPGDPSVAQRVLGNGYQIACHAGHHDICAAVKLSFGKFKGCTGAVCPDGLGGVQVPTCGHGGRVGRGVIELAAGGTMTLVSIHASSGYDSATIGCREKQFDQIFVSLDGAPAANGGQNVILGDFNTDPGRLTVIDASAQTLASFVGKGKAFHFVTDVGTSVPPTYVQTTIPGLPVGVNIDHVVSDALSGSCWTAGVTSGHAAIGAGYFDHKPAVCTVKP
jgi:endonuclease/exonuclease/phosphatase family metal-dependent hydrolase